MNARQTDGLPLRIHLQKQANGIFPDPVALDRLLSSPDCPQDTAHLWAYYNQLDSRRDWGEAGPKRVGWEAINSWQTVRRIELEPWELDALLMLEDLYLAAYAESKSK